jgi:hypothetical protein
MSDVGFYIEVVLQARWRVREPSGFLIVTSDIHEVKSPDTQGGAAFDLRSNAALPWL